MSHPIVSLVAAMAENRVIGRDGSLPWRLPADMRHFVSLTRGKPVIMGRKSFDDIGRPLPRRHNIVLTRDRAYTAAGCTVAHDTDAALAAAGDADEVMVIGGEQVYRLFLPQAGRIYLTIVHAEPEGDTFFPTFEDGGWRLGEEAYRPADEDNPYAMTFRTYLRG